MWRRGQEVRDFPSILHLWPPYQVGWVFPCSPLLLKKTCRVGNLGLWDWRFHPAVALKEQSYGMNMFKGTCVLICSFCELTKCVRLYETNCKFYNLRICDLHAKEYWGSYSLHSDFKTKNLNPICILDVPRTSIWLIKSNNFVLENVQKTREKTAVSSTIKELRLQRRKMVIFINTFCPVFVIYIQTHFLSRFQILKTISSSTKLLALWSDASSKLCQTTCLC